MAVFMVFMIGEAALAADDNGSLYLDAMIGGDGTWLMKGTDAESGSTTTINDFDISSNPWAFGGDYAFGAFVISADYISGHTKASEGDGNHDLYDYTLYDLGLGYRIVNKDSFKLDLKALYYHLSDTDQTGTDSEDQTGAFFTYSMNGYMLDLKASVDFSDQFSLTASYGASLSGDVSNHYIKVPNIKKSGTLKTADIKLIYMFSSNFGASLGYRMLNFEPKYSAGGIRMEFPNKIDGFTVGVYFRY